MDDRLESLEDVEKWVQENDTEGAGASNLVKAMNAAIITGPSAKWARDWLDERENGARRRAEAEKLDLARRSTDASETSAAAAQESARHAADSAKWAKWAIFVALAALVVSAWPYIRDIAP